VIAEPRLRPRSLAVKTVRIEGRASATGSAAANQRLTETRTQVVYDALQKAGSTDDHPAGALGQATATDTSVMDRRVDIVLLK